MKNLLFVLLFLPLIAFGQEQPQDLFETVNIHVKKGQEKALEAAVKAHNAKFHPEDGNFHARLFYNINGPSGGTYSWIMGPTSWTAMDSRPTDGDHDADWKKVTALVDKFDSPHYWKYSPKLSSDGGNASPAKRLIWIYDIKRGQAKRWSEVHVHSTRRHLVFCLCTARSGVSITQSLQSAIEEGRTEHTYRVATCLEENAIVYKHHMHCGSS
jgi:hypothetical protein